MHTNIDQSTIDEKIQQFMANHTPLHTFGKSIVDPLHHPKVKKSPIKGVSYETLEWPLEAR